ncbi:ATP-binding protein [Yokenella regensburgei]|uniref:ATP-binding protein n=1 Tax=Yokenella regensburgei TaxID=158877 RepID=UPI003ED882EA
MEQSIIPLNINYPGVNDGDSAFLFRELERIDLCLQRYAMHERDRLESHVLDGFLLSEDEMALRTEMPEGVPHWLLARERQPDYIMFQEKNTGGLLALLVNRFELTALETDILLLGLLPYFDSRYFHLFAALQRSGGKNLPSFELVQALFGGEGVLLSEQHLSLLPQSPLLKSQLITVRKAGDKQGEDWAQTLFLTSTGIFHYLTGNDYLSSPLSACARWYQADPEEELHSTMEILSALQAQDDTCEGGMHPVLILEGAAESGQLAAVRAAASQRRQSILFLDMSQLPEKPPETQWVLGEAAREVRMRDAILVLKLKSKNGEEPEDENWMRQLRQPGLRVVLLCNRDEGKLRFEEMPQLVLDMPGLSRRDRETLLGRALPSDFAPDMDIAGFCRRFSFTRDTLPHILQEARGYRNLRCGTGAVSSADLNRALRMHARKNFGKLAQRREPQRTFDDLVVSVELREQLTEILVAARYRDTVLEQGFGAKIGYGTGISALFCGDSGTGKTMAAEVIAGQLDVDLIKVDLSTVVNKYIGETEKNLSRIFDLAEADAGVLFFDEADALFGKRTSVKDSKDRNANIEVAYLLQRLENHPGLVILSTNNRNHLDDAFSRRFTFITLFDFPSAPLREEMWRRIWPQGITLAPDVSFAVLASTAQLTGANIRNIALMSAWLAAEEATETICDRHIRLAMKRELAKIGRISY